MQRDDERDPREHGNDPAASQEVDPQSGSSDDPRVDPTPDTRQSETDAATRRR